MLLEKINIFYSMDLYPAQQTVRHIAKLCEGKERKKKKKSSFESNSVHERCRVVIYILKFTGYASLLCPISPSSDVGLLIQNS